MATGFTFHFFTSDIKAAKTNKKKRCCRVTKAATTAENSSLRPSIPPRCTWLRCRASGWPGGSSGCAEAPVSATFGGGGPGTPGVFSPLTVKTRETTSATSIRHRGAMISFLLFLTVQTSVDHWRWRRRWCVSFRSCLFFGFKDPAAFSPPASTVFTLIIQMYRSAVS